MSKIKPVHLFQQPFAVENDSLMPGGIPLERLAMRVGKTPFYAYDRHLLRERVRWLKDQLPQRLSLHYAMKANPMPAVVHTMAELLDGLDVASAGELRVALDTGMDPRHISFAGPGKRDDELLCAIASGILINVESPHELERIAQIARHAKLPARIAIRVNPEFELKASGMKMTGGPKPFGIDTDQVPGVLAHVGALGLVFEGFHIFSGSQNLRHEAIIEAQSKALELAVELSRHAPAPVRSLNIGGGFGIPYFPGESALNLSPITEHLAQLVTQSKSRLPQAQLVIELGRYLVGEAGIYVCQIIDRKISKGEVFLVTDGGLHHHLAASGNFGQVIRKNYPVVIGNKVQGQQREIASVVGPLCTPLDLLADKMELAKADVGDYVVVFQSGAYGRSASPAGFLSHPAVVEVLV